MNSLVADVGKGVLWCFACAFIFLGINTNVFKAPKLHVPRVGKSKKGFLGLAKARADFLVNGRRLAEEGYSKYKDSMYIIQTADMDRVILPCKYADELRAYPQHILSSVDAQCERHLASWNTLDVVKRSSLHVDVTRVQLTQSLGRLAGHLADEVEHGLSREFPSRNARCRKDYQYVYAYDLATKLVSRTVSRALVGLPLCRNDQWFETSMGYMAEAFAISSALRPCSHILRYLMYPFLGARVRIQNHLKAANHLLVPVINQRIPEDSNNADVVQWMVDNAQRRDKDPRELTHKILFLNLASMSSSIMAVVHAIYDLCAMPQHLGPLREEIDAALLEEGSWTLAMVRRLNKLDSFLKESQRLNHPGLFSFNRKVLKTIHLSDGAVLPAGTFISMPTYSIARDATFYDSPLTFQPFRFSDLRQRSAEDANRHQFTSTGPTNLAFGYGLAACPGRSFAALEIKLILGRIIHDFDFKFPEGQTDRPENIYVDERIWPSKTQQIGFRLRLQADKNLEN